MIRQKTKKLTPLEAKWEAILKAEGLGNIEHQPSGQLSKYDSFYFSQFTKEEYRERELYYRLARDLVYKDVFQNKVDKLIWELHSEGIDNSQIAKKLKKKTSLRTIERRVAMYKKYLCTWSEMQLKMT